MRGEQLSLGSCHATGGDFKTNDTALLQVCDLFWGETPLQRPPAPARVRPGRRVAQRPPPGWDALCLCSHPLRLSPKLPETVAAPSALLPAPPYSFGKAPSPCQGHCLVLQRQSQPHALKQHPSLFLLLPQSHWIRQASPFLWSSGPQVVASPGLRGPVIATPLLSNSDFSAAPTSLLAPHSKASEDTVWWPLAGSRVA